MTPRPESSKMALAPPVDGGALSPATPPPPPPPPPKGEAETSSIFQTSPARETKYAVFGIDPLLIYRDEDFQKLSGAGK